MSDYQIWALGKTCTRSSLCPNEELLSLVFNVTRAKNIQNPASVANKYWATKVVKVPAGWLLPEAQICPLNFIFDKCLIRFLWKMWEGGKLKMLVSGESLPADHQKSVQLKVWLETETLSGLNVPIVDEDTRKDRKIVLVNYFTENRFKDQVKK